MIFIMQIIFLFEDYLIFVCSKCEKVRKAELIKDNVKGIVFDET